MATDSSKRFFSTHEAAELLGYTHDYISKMCREGKLEGIRLGRSWVIDPEVLEAFKAKHQAHLINYRETASLRARGVPVPLSMVGTAPRAEPVVYEPVRKEIATEPIPSPFFTRIPRDLAVVPLALMIVVGTAFAYTNLEKITSQGSGSEFANIASASASNFGESLALFTYETVQGFFNATEKVVASLFAPDEQAVVVKDVAKEEPEAPAVVVAEPVPAVATTTRVVVASEPAPIYRYGDSYYNEYYTITSTGVSAEYVEGRIKLHIGNLDDRLDNRLDDVRESSGGGGGGSGSVTSVDVSGGTTGFTFSGGPITSSGSLTLSGTLALANGGTGTSSAPTYGQMLLGNSLGGYDLVATSSLGITGSGTTLAGTTGQFPYYASNGSELTATSSIFLATNGNVGIGSTSPAQRLSVHGNGLISGNLSLANLTATGTVSTANLTIGALNGPLHVNNGVVSATTSIGVLYGGTGLTSAPSYGNILVGDSSGGYMLTATSSLGLQASLVGTQGQLAYFSGANTAVGTSSLFIATSGNVGIGTTNPGSLLEVNGTAQAITATRGMFSINSNTTQAVGVGGTIGLGGSDGTQTRDFANIGGLKENATSGNYAGYLSFATRANGSAPAERMRIDSVGNVGIGSTSPYAKLSVVGQVVGEYFTATSTTATSTFNAFSLGTGLSLGTGTYIFSSGSNLIETNNRLTVYDSVIAEIVDVFGSYLRARDNIEVAFGTDLDYSLGYNSADDTLNIVDGSNVSANVRFTLNASGNVGVGSTSPFSKLAAHANNGETNTALFAIGSSTASATTTLFTVLNTGNVGIGTTNPGQKFEIESSTGALVRLDNTANSRTWDIGSSGSASWFVSDATGGTIPFIIEAGTPASTLHLASTGIVGIGTSSPFFVSGKGLAVENSGAAAGITINRSDASIPGSLDILSGLTTNAVLGRGAKDLTFGTNGTENMRIANGGNVGIGTTTPAYKLDITGNARIGWSANPSLTLTGLKSAGNEWYMQSVDADGRFRIYDQTSNAERITITQAGNVGIGTTSPSFKLQVTDSTAGTANTLIVEHTDNTNANSNARLVARVGGPSGGDPFALFTYAVVGGSTWSAGVDTSDTFKFKISNNATLGVNDRLVIDTSGNVGIGTTTPGYTLGVAGSLGVNSYINFPIASIAPSGQGIYNSAGTHLTYVGGSTGSQFNNNANNTTLMTILNAGDVGIGTTTPDGRLQVYADSTATNGLHVTGVEHTDQLALFTSYKNASNPNPNVTVRGSRGTPVAPTAVQSGDSLMNFGARGYGATAFSSGNRARILMAAAENWTDSAQGTYMLFATTPIGGTTQTERMRIDSTGNVGIGTTTPYGNLHVSGSSFPSIYLGNTGTSANLGQWRTIVDNSGNYFIQAVSDDNATGNSALQFVRSGANISAAVFPNGNVGIGSINPQAALQVGSYTDATGEATNKGQIIIANPNVPTTLNSTGSGGLEFKASPSGNGYGWKIGALVPASTDLAIGNRLNSASWTEIMRLTSGGNVGIGTTTPGSRLVVSNGQFQIDATTFARTAYSNAGAFVWTTGMRSANDYHIYRESGAGNVIIDTANLGIGTSSPVSPLSVVGVLRLSDNSGLNSHGGIYADTNGLNVEAFNYGNTVKRNILLNAYGGNVGIGTTTPVGKLSIYENNNSTTIGTKSKIFLENDSVTGSAGSELVFGTGDVAVERYAAIGTAIVGNDGATGSRGNLYFATKNASADSVLTERLVILNSGNVGIGDTSATARLFVNGSTAAHAATFYSNHQSTTGLGGYGLTIGGNRSGGNAEVNLIYGSLGAGLQFGSWDGATYTDRVIFDETGNVGIGTTNPRTKLQLLSTTSVSSMTLGNPTGVGLTVSAAGDNAYGLNFGAFTDGSAWIQNSRLDGTATAYNLSLQASGGNVGIGTTGGGERLTVVGSGATSATAAFQALNSSLASLMYVRNDGNVGIGTTTPEAGLSISGADSFGLLHLTNTSANGTASISFRSADDANGGAGQWLAGKNLGGLTSDEFSIWQGTAGNRLTINSSGNVGIGTTTPGYLLTLGSAAATTRLLSVGDPVVAGTESAVKINTDGTVASIQTQVNGQVRTQFGSNLNMNNGAKINFYSDNGSTLTASVDSATGGGYFLGNVGIGTTTSSAKFTVAVGDIAPAPSADMNTGVVVSSGLGSRALNIGVNNTAGYSWLNAAYTNNSAVADNLVFMTGATERMRVSSTGNVGIGTSTPDTKINVLIGGTTHSLVSAADTVAVFRNSAVAGSNTRFDILSGTSGQSLIQLGDDVDDDIGGIAYDNSSNALSFRTNNTSNRMLIDSAGNVGVASTTPWRTFSVSGTASLAGLSTGAGAGALCLSANNEVLYNAGASCTVSSGRFKNDIEDSELGLAAVLALRPVSYFYNDEVGVEGEQLGFIAEEVEGIDPRLVVLDADGKPFTVKYDQMTAVLAKAIQEMNLNVESLASTSPQQAEEESFASRFFGNIVAWFGDAANGIGDFVANRVRTTELCVGDGNGETCLTRAQLDALLAGAASAQAEEPEEEPETGGGQPPVEEPAPEEPIVEQPPAEEPPAEEPASTESAGADSGDSGGTP